MDGQQQWYVLRDSRIQGPYTEPQLSRYMLLGRVRRSDQFSVDGQCWQSIEVVADLVPDSLKNIGTDAGWRSFLDERAGVDERAGDESSPMKGRSWRQSSEEELQALKREWLHARDDDLSNRQKIVARRLPIALLWGSVGLVCVLLLFQQLI